MIKRENRYGPGWFPRQCKLHWRLYRRPHMGPWLLIYVSYSHQGYQDPARVLTYRRIALYIAPFMVSLRSRSVTHRGQWFKDRGY
jgi:hypothetical protein